MSKKTSLTDRVGIVEERLTSMRVPERLRELETWKITGGDIVLLLIVIIIISIALLAAFYFMIMAPQINLINDRLDALPEYVCENKMLTGDLVLNITGEEAEAIQRMHRRVPNPDLRCIHVDTLIDGFMFINEEGLFDWEEGPRKIESLCWKLYEERVCEWKSTEVDSSKLGWRVLR